MKRLSKGFFKKSGASASAPLLKPEPSCWRLLGVRVHPRSIPEWHTHIAEFIQACRKGTIVSLNLHGVYVYHHDARMRELHERPDTYVRLDGMPLVLAGRLLGFPLYREHRVTWVDWIAPLMAEAATCGWRVFYLGSTEDVARRGAEILRVRHPNLQLAYANGYFDATLGSAESQERLAQINAFGTQVLIVGMGMPRQEHWILDNLDGLRVNAILTSGAAMEYVVGAVSTPPRWIGSSGLEWLYRFAENPRRFWKRYLLEPWFLVPLFVRDLLCSSRQPKEGSQ